jgi:hypothetical protein
MENEELRVLSELPQAAPALKSVNYRLTILTGVDFKRVRRYIQRDSSGPTDAHTLQTTHCECGRLRSFGAILRTVASGYEEFVRRTDEVHRAGFLRGDELPR